MVSFRPHFICSFSDSVHLCSPILSNDLSAFESIALTIFAKLCSGIFLPSTFIIRCRATRCNEYPLPVIYRSLFLPKASLSVCPRVSFPPFGVLLSPPRSPSARALISFLDGAHYLPDCRQIPTSRWAIPSSPANLSDLDSRSRARKAHRKLLRMSFAPATTRCNDPECNRSGVTSFGALPHRVLGASFRALVQPDLMVLGGLREKIVVYRDALPNDSHVLW